jgi:hypothetical protein
MIAADQILRMFASPHSSTPWDQDCRIALALGPFRHGFGYSHSEGSGQWRGRPGAFLGQNVDRLPGLGEVLGVELPAGVRGHG